MNNYAYNADCMEIMAQYPDGYFDLAVVDPPYGLKRFERKNEKGNRVSGNAKINEWDRKPGPEYFKELFRVSKREIIFGANNFELPPSEYFLIWDKMQKVDNFASAEFAWTNCPIPAKVFRYDIQRVMCQRKAEGGKIHPTQKPVALYAWIFGLYAKPGYKILDTHLGSQSSRIAAYDAGLDFVGCEIDKEYYTSGCARYEAYTAQTSIFDTPQKNTTTAGCQMGFTDFAGA